MFQHIQGTNQIKSAIFEWQALVENLTRSKKGFYAAEINTNPKDRPLTTKEWIKAADILEAELGIEGQPRMIVLHEQKGRTHIHVLWQSTYVDEKKIFDDSQNYEKHEFAARLIEKEYDLKRVIGPHTREPDEPRPEPKFNKKENQKAKLSGLDPAARKAEITELFEQSDSGRAFVAALEDKGYHLARGDLKPIFMVVDPYGHEFDLTRTIKGRRKKEINAFLHPLKPEQLMSVDEVNAARESPAHAMEEAADLAEQHKEKERALRAQQKLEMSRMEALHRLQNEQIEKGRAEEEPTGFIIGKTVFAWLTRVWQKINCNAIIKTSSLYWSATAALKSTS